MGWNCKDVSREEGKDGGLIKSDSVKDRGDTAEDRASVQCVINFSFFCLLLSIRRLLLCRQLVNV